MDAITYTIARAKLAKMMSQVCEDHEPLIITRAGQQSVVRCRWKTTRRCKKRPICCAARPMHADCFRLSSNWNQVVVRFAIWIWHETAVFRAGLRGLSVPAAAAAAAGSFHAALCNQKDDDWLLSVHKGKSTCRCAKRKSLSVLSRTSSCLRLSWISKASTVPIWMPRWRQALRMPAAST